MRIICTLALCLAVVALLGFVARAEVSDVVFLSKSSGFQHSCIKWENGTPPSHVDKILTKLLGDRGIKALCTKDAELINKENLKNYDLVIFYTTEDLTTMGSADEGKVMGPNGVQELLDWIKAGGAFMGYHCASDTFHRRGNPSPYLDMLGGEFAGHGAQFVGTLKIVDTDHPTMANIPQDFSIKDEWYFFQDLMKDNIHVLALLDPGKERERQADKYNIPNYPVIWCSTFGEGRVYYNAMGHREDVWENEVFQQSVLDAIAWTTGNGPAMADPNYAEVVPDTIEEK